MTIINEEDLEARPDPAFRADVLLGLGAKPRAIPPRWFYDRRGSELFEAITQLPEYYPTRTESALLAESAGEIAQAAGLGRTVVEFGSGSSAKTPSLLRAIEPEVYVPIDISAEFLHSSARSLAHAFPHIAVHPVAADFTAPLMLPKIGKKAKLGFFPGSTIGNFTPGEAVELLRTMGETLGAGAGLLIGVDRVKPREVLEPAYDDAAGVTAAFNLNLLRRINRELNGDVPLEAFEHLAFWNPAQSRIEMHLRAKRAVRFRVGGHVFSLSAGETIHTENSYKYSLSAIHSVLAEGGWTSRAVWNDERDWFSLILADRNERAFDAPATRRDGPIAPDARR